MEETLIHKVRNTKREEIIFTEIIKGIIKHNFTQFQLTKFENPDKIGNFLGKYNLLYQNIFKYSKICKLFF